MSFRFAWCRAATFLGPIVAGLCLVSACASTPIAPAPGSRAEPRGLERVRWLVGAWNAVADDGAFEETWTAPEGGVMRGRGRFVRAGRELFFEDLRLEERGAALVYVASPSGAGPTEFTSTLVEADVARFENPAHDDPRAIEYRRLPDGTLRVQLTGASTRTFTFRRP